MIPHVDEKYLSTGKLISTPWRYVDTEYSKPYNVMFLVQERRNVHDMGKTDVSYCELLGYKNFNKFKKVIHEQMKWYEPKLCELHKKHYPTINKINDIIYKLSPWRWQ